MESIGSDTSWARVIVPSRPDFIGIRTLPDGSYEFLVHDEALCCPYYVATTRTIGFWAFEWNREKKAYVQTAKSIAEQS